MQSRACGPSKMENLNLTHPPPIHHISQLDSHPPPPNPSTTTIPFPSPHTTPSPSPSSPPLYSISSSHFPSYHHHPIPSHPHHTLIQPISSNTYHHPISVTFFFTVYESPDLARFHSKLTGWPSGLRRYVQVVVSKGAWVRIPLQSRLFRFFALPFRCILFLLGRTA